MMEENWREYWNPKQKSKKHINIAVIIITAPILFIIIFAITGGRWLKLPNDGTLDIETTRYIDDVTATEQQLNCIFQALLNQNNIVEIRKKVNNLDEIHSFQNKQRVANPYKNLKKETDKEYRAIIDTLKSAIESNGLNDDIFSQILQAFSDAVKARTNTMLKLFDENGIKYQKKENEDGSFSIEKTAGAFSGLQS